MNEFTQLFAEITKNFKDLSRRIAKFETWEPNEGSKIGCGVYRNANQAIPADNWTTIVYDTELWDDYSMHSAGVFTFPQTGRYLINTITSITPYAGTFYQRWSFGTASLETRGNFNAAYEPFRMSQIYRVTAGETMQVQVFRVGAGATVAGAGGYPYEYTQASIHLLAHN